MQSALAVVLDEDPSVRERARESLTRAGLLAVAVGTPREALEILRANPFAVVVAVCGDPPAPAQCEALQTLFRLRAGEGAVGEDERILGRSGAADGLRRRVQELAASRAPVIFAGEAGTGRRHAARCLHALSAETGEFVVVPPGDRAALDAALNGDGSTVFVASLDAVPWPTQETLAAALASATLRPRIVASTIADPDVLVDEGRLLRSLSEAFAGSIVRVPPLRERRSDIPILVKAFIEELCRLNGLPPLTVAPEAMTALETHPWPGNVAQLRGAVEAAVILATDGVVRLSNLPPDLFGDARPTEAEGLAGRRFREAKRSVVGTFERAYLADLLKRNQGNVTGAADQSGMLRSALQRLLRKHGLHSADFRRLRGPGDSDLS